MTTSGVLIVAILAGVAVALQGQFMGAMDRTAGTLNSVTITYGLGAIVAALLWLTRRPSIERVRDIPWYAWTAGVLGLVIVGGIGYAAPRLGLARTLIITVAAQLLAAKTIEHFALLGAARKPFVPTDAVGFALTIAGVWLVVK